MVASMRPLLRSSALLSLVLAGCGARTNLAVDEQPLTSACATEAPTCVQPGAPCEMDQVVSATCDAASKQWSCPRGAHVYASVAPAICRPFADDPEWRGIEGSLVAVPTASRCLWIAETVRGVYRNVAFASAKGATYGTCPKAADVASTNVVTVEGEVGPGLQVQITGGQRIAGETRVTYRLFRVDPSAPFGVTELGTGLGRFDEASQKIVVSPKPRFSTDLDLGDASLVFDGRLHVYGCPPPIDFLTEGCKVARFFDGEAMELFAGDGKWVASVRGRDGADVFTAGPWVSAIARDGDQLTHLYAVGFGSTIERHVATSPEGPWSDGPTVARCDLPPEDPKAFCAGPVVHPELADPTRRQWVVSYGVGTTDPDRRAANPEAYGTRLHWMDR